MKQDQKPQITNILHETEERLKKLLRRSVFLKIEYADEIMEDDPVALKIRREVCHVFRITVNEFTSKKRNRHLVEARCAFSYIIRKKLGFGFKRIGYMVGNRDHSTIMYQVEVCEDLLKYNREFKEVFNKVINASSEEKQRELFGENKRSHALNYRLSTFNMA